MTFVGWDLARDVRSVGCAHGAQGKGLDRGAAAVPRRAGRRRRRHEPGRPPPPFWGEPVTSPGSCPISAVAPRSAWPSGRRTGPAPSPRRPRPTKRCGTGGTRWAQRNGPRSSCGGTSALVAAFEAVDGADLETLQVKLPFLPAPVDLATAVGFRLSEHALHSWDVRVAFTPDAVVPTYASELLVDRVGMMAGWIGRADAWTGRPTSIEIRTTPTGPSGWRSATA